jgi:methyltransferase (TIGR00027 family)
VLSTINFQKTKSEVDVHHPAGLHLPSRMDPAETPIHSISDTARWVAVYRARESQRADAVFRDPFAERLAGDRGKEIAASMPFAEKSSWSFIARTWLIDQLISEQVRAGVEMVVNLAAGLDARPYRMDLPRSLQWVEVDLPEILAYKEDVLRNEKPVCGLEHVRLDLSNAEGRHELFSRLGQPAKRVLVVTEGLLVYLTEEEVTALGNDLAAQPAFQHWIIDLVSPALLKMLARKMSAPLDQAGIPLKFAPHTGPEFFNQCGWKLEQVHSILHTAAKIKRLPLLLRLIATLSPVSFRANRPWSAVCLLGKSTKLRVDG